MSAQVHDHTRHGAATHQGPQRSHMSTVAPKPKWLVPGLVVALLAIALVVAGVVSVSTVLYAGLFGGMMLMHQGGHGHGGHGAGGAGRGHSMHGDGAADAEDLSGRSSGAQPNEPDSTAGLDERARENPTTSETDDHDQHRAHSCH